MKMKFEIEKSKVLAGILGLALGAPQIGFAEAPHLYWYWVQGVKTSDCRTRGPVAMQATLGKVPLRKGDNTWWVKTGTATATVQCIKTSGERSMAVMIVTSDNAAEARAVRDRLKGRIHPNQSGTPAWFDPAKEDH